MVTKPNDSSKQSGQGPVVIPITLLRHIRPILHEGEMVKFEASIAAISSLEHGKRTGFFTYPSMLGTSNSPFLVHFEIPSYTVRLEGFRNILEIKHCDAVSIMGKLNETRQFKEPDVPSIDVAVCKLIFLDSPQRQFWPKS